VIPIRGDIMLQAILSGSRTNAQSRARQFLANFQKTGGSRLWENRDQPREQPFDFDLEHLRHPGGYPAAHESQEAQA
jgi:hypothetical protein